MRVRERIDGRGVKLLWIGRNEAGRFWNMWLVVLSGGEKNLFWVRAELSWL